VSILYTRFGYLSRLWVIHRPVLQRILRMPYLSAFLYSIGTRLILTLHLQSMSQPPSTEPDFVLYSENADAVFHSQLQAKLIDIQSELCLGTSGHAWRGMGLSIDVLLKADEDTLVSSATKSSIRLMDTLLHPRLPPSARPPPKTESLMLFREDETKEERDERLALHLEDGMEVNYEMDSAIVERITDSQDAPMQEKAQSNQKLNEVSDNAMLDIEETPPEPKSGVLGNLPQSPVIAQIDQQPAQQTSMDILEPSNTVYPFIRTSFTPKHPLPAPQSKEIDQVAAQSFPATSSRNDTEDSDREKRPWHPPMESDSDEEIPSINMSSDSE
jgi:hypothetical protein